MSRVRTHRVGAPDALARVHVISRHVAANAELSARNTDDDLVLDDERSARARLALLGVGVDRLPEFLAGLRVESDERRVGLVQEDLAFGILHATVDRVAAHDGDDRRILLGLVLPDDLVFVVQVQGEHDVRERRVEVHRVADHEGRTFVTAQNARRERPSNLQAADVGSRDLVELRVAGTGIVTGLQSPVLRICRQLRTISFAQTGAENAAAA